MKINFLVPIATSFLISSCSAHMFNIRKCDGGGAAPSSAPTPESERWSALDGDNVHQGRGGPEERQLAADLADFFNTPGKDKGVAPRSAPATPASKGWPVVYGDNIYQGDGGPVELRLAGNLENYASDVEQLKKWMLGRMRGRARTDPGTPAALAWATKTMLFESDDLKARIYAADFLLRKEASPIAVPPPTMYQTISAEFPAGVDSPAQWNLAVSRANLARGLAYLLELRASDAAKAPDIAAAQNKVDDLRSRVEAAEHNADQ